MQSDRARTRALFLWMVAIACYGPVTLSQSAPALSVDAGASRHAISPQIYGIASYGLDANFAKEIKVPNIRWGGDGTTRYNWMVDSSNAGFDWYFMGGNGETTPVPSAGADLMVNTYKPANALITIPIIPYVNKLAAWNCSFPVSVYGAQQSTNPYVHPNGDNCGNSLEPDGKTQLIDNNIYANHIDNTTSLQQQWVQHLVSTFGTAANGGVKFYQLDNEPFGWSNTHRDVMPNGATYPMILQLGQQYAAAVKQADSTALVLGPSDFTLGGWIGTTSQQGGLYAGQYYLQQMAAYDQAHGQRILDYFDEHYYFQFSTPAEQLASTRTLWDKTYNGGTWVEQYYLGNMQLIPRFRGWISTYYPGTLLSISEYSIDSGQKSIVDAIAEMDVLGIFGRESLDFANMWNTPAPQDPIAYAFRLFRNYDGNGGQFGDTSISAASTDQGSLSLYAAQRSSDNAVTILAVNKTTQAISSAVAIANLNLGSTAQVYTYSQANLTSIVHAADAPIASGSVSYTFPAYSAILFVVQPAAAGVTATTITLTASAMQITVGQSITFTVAVTAPAGNVTLLDGSTSLGTAALSSGTATFTIASLAVGSHSITAAYAGDATDGASTSSALTIQVNAAPAAPPQATAVTLTAAPSTAVSGQAVNLTASVTPASATGTVTFQDGGASLASPSLAGGSANLSVTTLSAGTHSLTAVYSGDAADSPSTSSPTVVTITAPAAPPAADYGFTLSSSALTMTQGTTGNLTVAVTPQNGFNAALSFACTGLPGGWACTFAPATLSGSTPETTKLTISPAPSGMVLALVWPLPLLGLFGIKPRKALLGGVLLLLAGCGASSTGTQPTTYNVTVTASGTSAPTHTQAFALTLNQ